MKRCALRLANAGMVFLSIAAAFWCLSLLDRALAPLLAARLWPGPMGLLFNPGTDEAFEMRDYQCTEHINAFGFRDHEISARKTCAYRVAAIGDSFTYGWGVNIEDAWCKRLERNLRAQGIDAEVLNLGKPAAGPAEYASIADSVIPVLRPDLVLVGVLAGDDLQQGIQIKPLASYFPNLVHLVRYWHSRALFNTTQQPQKRSAAEIRTAYVDIAKGILAGMPPEQRARYDRLEEPVRRAFLDGTLNPWLIDHATGKPGNFMNTAAPGNLRAAIWATARALGHIQAVAHRYGARVAVISIPEGFYVNKEAYRNVQRIGFEVAPSMQTNHVADDAIRDAAARYNIPFHAVSDGFREHVDEPGLYFEFDRHFTAAGNALFGDLATSFVASQLGDAATPHRRN